MEKLVIVDVYPDLLGTYGDGGNAEILKFRSQLRGYDVEIIRSDSTEPLVKNGDIYLLGGGEDAPQRLAKELLEKSGALSSALESGAVVLGVCAGYQILGESYVSNGNIESGLGLIEVSTSRKSSTRHVGEIIAKSPVLNGYLLTGYENHASETYLGKSVKPLGSVIKGSGNFTKYEGSNNFSEGVIYKTVVGTYLHGPVLARNPKFADYILEMKLGRLESIDDTEIEALRDERLSIVLNSSGAQSFGHHIGSFLTARKV